MDKEKNVPRAANREEKRGQIKDKYTQHLHVA